MWKLKQASKSSRGSCTRKMEDNCADFISELPDHLLLHIFSFLDETAVFRSSVLSRRWHYLWTLVPFPMALKKMRSFFKEQKADIFKEKIRQEEEAAATIFKLAINISKSILQFFLSVLPFVTSEFIEFVVIHLLLTFMFMTLLYFFYFSHHSRVCDNEVYLKRLQVRDSRLNSHSITNIPRMEPLFPENYKPRYSKYVKLYCLIGMLLGIIISCSLITLKWKFDFKLGTGMSVWIVTPLVAVSINMGIGIGWF